jgi:hypothetical protein
MTLFFPDYDFEVESKVMMYVLHLDTPLLLADIPAIQVSQPR